MITNESPCVLRTGKVTDFDAKTLRARVLFPDLAVVSHWLPVMKINSLNTKDTSYLDEGEHVICLMSGTGIEAGYVLGAIFDDKNLPAIQNKDIRSVKFDDGTTITYNRNTHKLTVNVSGDIEVVAEGHIKFTAERIDLN